MLQSAALYELLRMAVLMLNTCLVALHGAAQHLRPLCLQICCRVLICWMVTAAPIVGCDAHWGGERGCCCSDGCCPLIRIRIRIHKCRLSRRTSQHGNEGLHSDMH